MSALKAGDAYQRFEDSFARPKGRGLAAPAAGLVGNLGAVRRAVECRA